MKRSTVRAVAGATASPRSSPRWGDENTRPKPPYDALRSAYAAAQG